MTIFGQGASQTEVADLDVAFGVYQDVARLQISVHNVQGMNVFYSGQ